MNKIKPIIHDSDWICFQLSESVLHCSILLSVVELHTYGFLVPVILGKFDFKFKYFRCPTIPCAPQDRMQFGFNQNLDRVCGFLLQNDTDSKAVIPYHLLLCLLNYDHATVLSNNNGIYILFWHFNVLAIYNESRTQTSIYIDSIVV